MAKATDNRPVIRVPGHVCVHVVKSHQLARLLTSAGPWTSRAGLVAAATPGSGTATAVTVLSRHAGAVAAELSRTLQQARETNDPGADELATVAGYLGICEAPVEPTPEPAPAPAAEVPQAPSLT